MDKNKGFTLVELSIVLVILGLLTGGVLTGQSLIRAAEMRSIPTEVGKYTVAFNTFRDKYFGLPGDITNATAYWGKDNANCGWNDGTPATPGTCNGNGDGYITSPIGWWDNNYAEAYRAWQQLALAGLVEGSFTGMPASGNMLDAVIGVNIPQSKMSGVGYSLIGAAGFGTTWNSNSWFPMQGTLGASIGRAWPGGNDLPELAFLKPEEAFNIDTKVDDGKPGSGKYATWKSGSGTNNNCNTGDDPATSQYMLTEKGVTCSFNIIFF